MLQRNPGPHALSVPSIPAEVQPGDTVDHPDLITGFEAADTTEPGPDSEPAANPGSESGPVTTSTRAGRKPPKTPETPAVTEEA